MVVRRRSKRPRRRLFPYGEWRYAVLVILLLVMASVAAKMALDALAQHPDLREAETAMTDITLTVFTLTFGFLFLTGGFGIWAIRKTSENEGRRRIGRFVDDMGYLSDGLLTVDAKGRVTGMNPAARVFCEDAPDERAPLAALFPCLTQGDLGSLVHQREPYEVERAFRRGDGELRGLRFRSQHTGDASLILVSDVTAAKARQVQDLQGNHLQILGRMARGVAHDFNNILCAISAEAALARRSAASPDDATTALDSIVGLSARGAELANRLVGLSRMDSGGETACDVEEHVHRSAELLRTALDPAWTVEVASSGPVPLVALGGSQLEQMLLGIGLTATDALERPGVARIEVRTEGGDKQAKRDPSRVAITVDVSYRPAPDPIAYRPEDAVPADDTGVVASVIRSLLEERGGSFLVFPGRDGGYTYQILLPALRVARQQAAAKLGVPEKTRAALAGCRTLLALPPGRAATDLEGRLQVLGLAAEGVHALPDLLERIDRDPLPEVLVMDRRLLGGEPNALIQAMVKLLPAAMLVVLSETPTLDRVGLPDEITFLRSDTPPDSLIETLAMARERLTAGVG